MTSFTEQNIRTTEKQSAGKPYPVYVKNLKDIGVKLYIVTVSNHDRKFFSEGQELIIKGELPALKCAGDFKLDQVKNTVKRTQQSETDYSEFLKELADAGVHTYVADFDAMQVTYKGKNAEEEYAEAIPLIN